MSSSFATQWFNSKSQINLFQSTMDYTAQIIKGNMEIRKAQEVAAVNAKYADLGRTTDELEAQVNKNYDEKTDAVNRLTALESNTKRLDDVRTQLDAALSALEKGSAEAFDLAINTINLYVGTRFGSPDSFIANNSGNTANWNSNYEFVSGGGMFVSVQKQFIGADYAVTTADGTIYKPSEDGKELVPTNGGPSLKFADIDMTYNGDQVTITAKDGGAVLAEGEFSRGGLGVLHSGAYGNLARDGSPESEANRARAKHDIETALRHLAQVELKLNHYSLGLESITSTIDNKNRELTERFQKLSDENLDKKQAEIRSITNRYDIAANSLSLTSGQNANFIYYMFQNDTTIKSMSMTEILMGQYSS